MQRNSLLFNIKQKEYLSASNLNANFDYTYNHTLKSNSEGHKKALPVWKSLKRVCE